MQREDFYTARLCAIVASIFRDENAGPLSPNDFMIVKEEKKTSEPMDADAVVKHLIMLNAANGGKVIERDAP